VCRELALRVLASSSLSSVKAFSRNCWSPCLLTHYHPPLSFSQKERCSFFFDLFTIRPLPDAGLERILPRFNSAARVLSPGTGIGFPSSTSPPFSGKVKVESLEGRRIEFYFLHQAVPVFSGNNTAISLSLLAVTSPSFLDEDE